MTESSRGKKRRYNEQPRGSISERDLRECSRNRLAGLCSKAMELAKIEDSSIMIVRRSKDGALSVYKTDDRDLWAEMKAFIDVGVSPKIIHSSIFKNYGKNKRANVVNSTDCESLETQMQPDSPAQTAERSEGDVFQAAAYLTSRAHDFTMLEQPEAGDEILLPLFIPNDVKESQ